MISLEKARQLRALIERAATNLSDEDALTGVELFPVWAANTQYVLDVRVRYDGKLYKCVQAHTSQSGWEPSITPALWADVAKPGEIPVWRQPTGAQDSYMTGDKVHFPDEEDPIYISTIDYNVYAPNVYGWEVLAR